MAVLLFQSARLSAVGGRTASVEAGNGDVPVTVLQLADHTRERVDRVGRDSAYMPE